MPQISRKKLQNSNGRRRITSYRVKLLVFQQSRLSMKIIPFLAFNHNHKCCSNQDHKKNHHAQEHMKYPGKPFSTRQENPAKYFVIFFKRKTFTTKINLSHKRVLKP
jgi:hypothetical protein